VLDETAGFYSDGLSEQGLRTLGGIAAQVTFANLGAHNNTGSSGTEAF